MREKRKRKNSWTSVHWFYWHTIKKKTNLTKSSFFFHCYSNSFMLFLHFDCEIASPLSFYFKSMHLKIRSLRLLSTKLTMHTHHSVHCNSTIPHTILRFVLCVRVVLFFTSSTKSRSFAIFVFSIATKCEKTRKQRKT